MATLSAKKRAQMRATSFALPKERKYPIQDKPHAVAALARVTQFGTPVEKKAVRAAVAKRYPGLPSSKARRKSTKM